MGSSKKKKIRILIGDIISLAVKFICDRINSKVPSLVPIPTIPKTEMVNKNNYENNLVSKSEEKGRLPLNYRPLPVIRKDVKR
jgi:hypothetical protein